MTVNPKTGAGAALAGAMLLAVGLLGSTQASAEGLEGSWRGGGRITLPSGATESARCRVNYSRESKTTYSADASCATASGRVDQSASLRQTGTNSYSGTFHNSEYGVSGSISVTVHGSSQSVSLEGGGASASLRLSR